jgi:hypothetical protein
VSDVIAQWRCDLSQDTPEMSPTMAWFHSPHLCPLTAHLAVDLGAKEDSVQRVIDAVAQPILNLVREDIGEEELAGRGAGGSGGAVIGQELALGGRL